LNSGFREICLDATGLIVTGVEDPERNHLEFEQDDRSVKIHMIRSYSADEEIVIKVYHKAHNTPDGLFFHDETDEYPWDKYDQVIGPRQGGGAEATSATILGLGVIHDPGPDQPCLVCLSPCSPSPGKTGGN